MLWRGYQYTSGTFSVDVLRIRRQDVIITTILLPSSTCKDQRLAHRIIFLSLGVGHRLRTEDDYGEQTCNDEESDKYVLSNGRSEGRDKPDKREGENEVHDNIYT